MLPFPPVLRSFPPALLLFPPASWETAPPRILPNQVEVLSVSLKLDIEDSVSKFFLLSGCPSADGPGRPSCDSRCQNSYGVRSEYI